MENTYWFRYYLMCSKIANGILGLKEQNFAELFNELEMGRFANDQMTRIFDSVNNSLAEITANGNDQVFEENDFDEISRLSTDEINEYYEEFCRIKLEFSAD